MEHEIRLQDGFHTLDKSYGFWVVRGGEHPLRILRTRVEVEGALRAVAEAWLRLSLDGNPPIEARGLVDSMAVLDRAEHLGGQWVVVMDFTPLDIWYVYLIAQDGKALHLGTVSQVTGNEADRRERIAELVNEARQMADQ